VPFLQHDDRVVVDMEGYSIESVCDYFGYSRIFLKVLYDEIGKDDIRDYDDMLDTMKMSL
jgi:nucleoside phosphorylase